MWLKVIVLFVIVNINYIHCKYDMVFNEFEMLESINSFVSEIRSEQINMMKEMQQLKAQHQQSTKNLIEINQSLKNIKADLMNFKEERKNLASKDNIEKLRKDQEIIKIKQDEYVKNVKEIKITQDKMKEDDNKIKKRQIEIGNTEKQHSDQLKKLREDQQVIYQNITEVTAIIQPLKANTHNVSDCTQLDSGVHNILIPGYSQTYSPVVCDAVSHGGGWLIVLRRMDGTERFQRNWKTYKKGFGNLQGEFFIGLDKLHALTASQEMQLLVLLEDSEGVSAHAIYDRFVVGDEKHLYRLRTLGKYEGTAGDALEYHSDMPFSTFDKDNDGASYNCAQKWGGGWWYQNCFNCKLTGKYGDDTFAKGINWFHFRDRTHSIKSAVMLIKPVKKTAAPTKPKVITL